MSQPIILDLEEAADLARKGHLPSQARIIVREDQIDDLIRVRIGKPPGFKIERAVGDWFSYRLREEKAADGGDKPAKRVKSRKTAKKPATGAESAVAAKLAVALDNPPPQQQLLDPPGPPDPPRPQQSRPAARPQPSEHKYEPTLFE